MSAQRGFTLVEALIAFAILAVVLVALYETMGTSLAGLARAGRLDEAVLVAESRLAEIAATKSVPREAAEGDVEGAPFRWRLEPIPDEAPEPPEFALSPLRPQKVKLTIIWREHGIAREIAIERVFLVRRQPGS